MDKDNLAVMLHAPNDIRIESTPLLNIAPGPNELLLACNFCGICGTDILLLNTGSVGEWVLREPFTPGHEGSGTVLEIGPDVADFKPGDHVAMEHTLPCMACEYCRAGVNNLCNSKRRKISGLPPNNGFLRRYLIHPADHCFKLPDNVSLEEGAVAEPLAVVVHAMRRAAMAMGQTVLICGAGTIGLLAVMAAKAYGAAQVVVTDVIESKLQLAMKIGADHIILVKREDDPKELSDRVIQMIGDRVHVTFECTGLESSTRLAVHATRSGGNVAHVGLGRPDLSVPLVEASIREINLIGVFTQNNCFPAAVYLIASGKVNVKPLITHVFDLENAKEAYATMKNGQGLKIMINCGGKASNHN